jgi:hypothetical protein
MFHPFLGCLPCVIFDAGYRLPASALVIRRTSIRQNVFLPLQGIPTKIRQYTFRSNDIYGMRARAEKPGAACPAGRKGGDGTWEFVVSIEKKLRSPARPGSVR